MVDRAIKISFFLCIFTIVMPALSITGWLFDFKFLTQIASHFPAMQINTALGLILTSIAILLLQKKEIPYRITSLVLAIIVFLEGSLTLSQYIFDSNLGIDTLFTSQAPSIEQPFPGRPSPQTSLNFMLQSMALIVTILSVKAIFISQLFLTLAFINSLISLSGYIFGISDFYMLSSKVPAIGMAIHTALSFILLILAQLFKKPDQGIMTLLLSNTRTGKLIRELHLVSFLALPLVGYFTKMGVLTGHYNERMQIVLFIGSMILITLGTLWKLAFQTEKEEELANNSLFKINQLNKDLTDTLHKLQVSEKRSSGILSISADAIISINEEQNIVLFNRGAEKMFGYEAKEVLGKSLNI